MTRATITQLLAMTAAAGLLFYFGRQTTATVLGAMACVVLLMALFAPGPLHTLQTGIERLVRWLATGLGLVLLTIVYFSVFLGGAIWLKLLRVDMLNRSFPGRGRSNWIDRIGYGTDKALYSKLYSRPHGDVKSEGRAQ
jgi:hypothetical protein